MDASEAKLPIGRTRLRHGVDPEEAVRNLAAEVVMQWGPEMTIPELDRLRAFVTGLDVATAERYLADARDATGIGYHHVESNSPGAGDNAVMAPFEDVEAVVRAKHPWIDDRAMGHLYNQACYYTWHG